MAQESSSTSKLTIDVTCTPRNRANLRRLKTTSIQSFQRWEKENELLYAMIEDESAWLSSLFPDAFISPELFFYALEDGVILCLLANFIQEMAEDFGTRTGKSVPGKKVTFHKSKKGSRESKLFYSRENVDKFLTWCRWHGIPEAILFESNDAVLVDECRTGGREIVICLMEIARRSSQYEIEVPQMIKLEREIEEEELSDTYGEEEHSLALEIESRGDKSPIDSDSGVESVFEEGDPGSARLSEFATDETEPVNQSMKKFEEEKKLRVTQKEESVSLLESSQPKTELDKKVCKIAQEYNIKIVHRLKEGKYIILGKTMFVRMLNEHLLVRIGGGWDTLEHYVMTHASKSTEGSATQPSSSNRKSSGVWSKLVDKVRRRESQPNIKESPVVISKRQRPDSSPSVYRLRDRVKKKLSVTEKDEKDISDAIRKIESSVTVKSPHSSPSFTSKTFFQLKSRFDKGRKSSRENLFDSNERKRMADQTVETITDEHPKETEPKQEETGTTMLLEFDTSQGRTEEHTTSTATVTDYSSNEFMYSQKQVAESSSADDVLLFNQQVQQSSWQSFSTNDPNDLLSLDNPPLFPSASLHPQQASEEKQAEIHNGDEEESRVEIPSSPDQEAAKSATDITAEITQEVETTPTGVSAQETAQAPSTLETEPIPDIEDRGLQESPEGEQADFGNVSGEADVINVSSSFESAPQDNVQQEPCYGEQYKEASDELLVSVEQTGTISNETKEEDELSSQLTIVASSEMETEETTVFQDGMMTVPSDTNAVFKEQEKPEEDEIPSQSTEEISQDVSVEKEKFSASAVVESENTLHEDKQVNEEELEWVNPPTQMTCDTATEDNEFVALDKEKGDEVQVTEAIPSDVQAHQKEEPEAAGGDGVMPLPLDADAFNKEQEKNEESEIPSQLTEELSQDVSVEQEKFPGSAVVVSENTHPEDKQVDEEEPEGDNPPTQMTFEDLRSSDTAVEDMEFVALDKEKDDEVTEAIPNDVQADEKEEPEAANGDGVMPVPLDADAFNEEQEKPEEDKLPSQITEELSQDASVEQEKFPASAVVESENTLHKEKQEEELKDKIVGSPTEEAERLPFAEQPTAEQQKVEQKEASHILPDTSSAAVNHKKTTKKPPVTTKKENVKAAGGSTSKTLLARKKETQKAERPKESAAKPSTRTTKPTSAKAAPKTKPLSAVPGARPTSATKRPLSAQTQKPGIDARPVTTTRSTPKTTTKLNESKRPSSTTTTKSSTVKDKQPLAPGEKQKSKSTESRSRSAALTKTTDRKDGKPAASSRPLSTKTIPLPATTKTAVKKTTTTTVKSANGSTSKTEVSKTTTTAGRGGATKTKTTVRKTTESGGKPKASEGTLHPTASARNNTREKPGSRPPSATTKGKPGSIPVAKGKPTSERPKSPTKGAAKKSAPSKEKVTTSVSPPAAAEPPTISSLKQETPDSSTPDVTADSKESVTRVIEYTEVMEGDGDIKVLQTKVLTETVSENGHEQTVTEETVVEESG